MASFDRRNPQHLKIAALLAAAPTIGVLLLFTVGEVTGGDVSGLQHLVQLLPLAVVLAISWRFPRVAGFALIVAGVIVLNLFSQTVRRP